MVAGGKAAGKAAGGFIKNMVGDLIRPAAKTLAKDGEKVVAKDAAKSVEKNVTKDVAEDTEKTVAKDTAKDTAKQPMRDAEGKAIPTDKLKHPQDHLLDRDTLDKSFERGRNAERTAEIDASKGVGPDDPAVRDLTKDYDGNPGDGKWPDPNEHPEGFVSPEAREPIVLREGETIDRFGGSHGRFTSPAGEPYAARALPPDNLAAGYHQYEVVKPLPAWAGPAAPAMGQAGGAVQHYLPYPVVDLIKGGYLREIAPKVVS